jgi:hypothetical protein
VISTSADDGRGREGGVEADGKSVVKTVEEGGAGGLREEAEAEGFEGQGVPLREVKGGGGESAVRVDWVSWESVGRHPVKCGGNVFPCGISLSKEFGGLIQGDVGEAP